MSSSEPVPSRLAGRPPIIIDWDYVEQCLMADCSGVEIASDLCIHYDTLYDQCKKKHGINFSEYSRTFKEKGDILLRKAQIKKALDGDNTMMVWLGKNRLKQSDSPVQDQIQEQALGKYDAMMKQLESLQELSSARKISENNNITESKS